ncbi:MAG: hypothetical protein ACLVB1_03880 [Blautia obeum]
MENIISATIVMSGCNSSGICFLFRKQSFCELCEQCNITFIGPPST